jgi:phosphate transport protein
VGELVVFLILLAFSIWMWRHSQKDAVDASNVTADWNDSKNDSKAEETQDETLESRQSDDQDIPELPSPAREKAGA